MLQILGSQKLAQFLNANKWYTQTYRDRDIDRFEGILVKKRKPVLKSTIEAINLTPTNSCRLLE